TLSLAGRLAKDRFQRTAESTQKPLAAEESASWYAKAYDITNDVFPGINAATMALLAGKKNQARHLADSVRTAAVGLRQTSPADYWLAATIAEASLILGRADEAAKWYATAAAEAKGRWGDLASMRRNVLLLQTELLVADAILKALGTGTVV